MDDLSDLISVGMVEEVVFQVGEEHTAVHVGSGSLKVLASPIMIAFMERAARDLLAKYLPTGYSSVGIHVDVRHLAPTPLGQHVRVRCEILDLESRRVTFSVQAWDEHEKVGEGKHQRAVIAVERFLERVAGKGEG